MDSLDNGEWKNIVHMTFEFNGENQLITDVAFWYDLDGSIMWGTKHVISYSGTQESELVQYAWDSDANDWELSRKEIYEYTGNLISKISDFLWNELTSDWDPDSEILMTYDSQNREIEGLTKNWSETDGAFVNSDMTLTEYHKDLKISRSESKDWDETTQDWSAENFQLTVNQFDNNDNMIESVYTYSMGFSGFSFELKDSTIFEYDGNNFLIVETNYNWQDPIGYLEFSKVEYSNDANGNILEDISYTYSGGNWVQYQKNIYTYRGTVDVESGLQIQAKFVLEQNYPNPFNPTTTIKYSINKTGNVELKVYDLLGNVITTLVDEIQNQGIHNVTFNASDLASGIYVYALKQDKQIITRKCLLTK
jgi:hypothetical protein